MTVKKLIEIADKLPPKALVVVPGYDHSYRGAIAHQLTALRSSDGQYSEDFGEDMTPEKYYGDRVLVLLIS